MVIKFKDAPFMSESDRIFTKVIASLIIDIGFDIFICQ